MMKNNTGESGEFWRWTVIDNNIIDIKFYFDNII